MEESKRFDEKIKQVLIQKSKNVEVSPELYPRIKSELTRSDIGRSTIMKKNIMKQAAVLAAVLCLGSATVFAASYIHSYISIGGESKTEYPTQNEITSELGYSANTVKEFENGFRFSDYNIATTAALDAEGNKIGDFKEITFDYTLANTDNKSPLSLVISKPLENETANDSGIQLTKDDMTFTYQESLYKFVPEDYKVTKKDQEKIDAGQLEISYGSDAVEEINYQFLNWQENGVRYSILAPNYNLTQEELLQMASEIIQ